MINNVTFLLKSFGFKRLPVNRINYPSNSMSAILLSHVLWALSARDSWQFLFS